jgi:VanZ family protein
MLVYAGLFFVIFRALFRTFPNKSIMKLFIWAIVISVLYAISDEIHQTFTPHREGTPRDVFIDSIGISLMFGYTKKYLSKLRFLL